MISFLLLNHFYSNIEFEKKKRTTNCRVTARSLVMVRSQLPTQGVEQSDTDSLTSINAITNTSTTKKHEVIQMVQETYTELTNDHKQITITWIPSHQGIEGNEKADSLAKEATTEEANILIPHQGLSASTTKAEKKEWNRIWTTTNRTKIHDLAHTISTKKYQTTI